MDHLITIRRYVEAMNESSEYHLVVINGPPGWGKSSTVERALNDGGFESISLASFSTPLNLYNFLSKHDQSIVLIDDASGVFTEPSSMAILKAATWPQGDGRRMVRWGSTSGKAILPEFEFRGKFVIICNSFPNSADGEAIKSRGFSWNLDVTEREARSLLRTAALDEKRFPLTRIAIDVAAFLCERLNSQTVSKINFRTLGKGYQLAKVHPTEWRDLLIPMLPFETVDPMKVVKELAKQDMAVKDQATAFQRRTNLRERSFYKYRRAAGLSK